MNIRVDNFFIKQFNHKFKMELTFSEFKKFYSQDIKPFNQLKRVKNACPTDDEFLAFLKEHEFEQEDIDYILKKLS